MLQTSQLEIIRDDTVSLSDLSRLRAGGVSVMRSAHVGNASQYNLAMAATGIPMLLVDHTITGVDRNYFPEYLNTQQANRLVAKAGQLSCRALVESVPAPFEDLGDSIYVDELHVAGLRRAIPGADVFTNTDYLRRNEQVAVEIIQLAGNKFPELFSRVVLRDGTVDRRPDAADSLTRLGVLQLSDDPRAAAARVLVPNEVDIITNFVIEAVTSGEAVQYHVSGPDMIRYALENKDCIYPTLQRLYAAVREGVSYRSQLPPQLQVRLVPGTEARYVTTHARRQSMDDLLFSVTRAAAEADSLNNSKKQFFQSVEAKDSAKRSAYLVTANGKRRQIDGEVAERLRAIPELQTPPRAPGYLTQYDALLEGGVYVPTITKETSMAGLAGISGFLAQALKRVH
jgi:hypothetical protein